jgi:glycosyltransferase involved in cell wall biosynthesis
MKIAMFTNTYIPHVGGVARAVKTLEEACREHGHEVRVIAPDFDGQETSPNVLRVPAIQHFNGSDFSVRLPVPNVIRDYIQNFKPDLIHSHHPFLLGDAALREARKMQVPIVFTHHTLYERYTHYVSLDSSALRRVVIRLATEYCNLCDEVIAPSGSIARLLRERGVTSPIQSIPTGIDLEFFASGNRETCRKSLGIPRDAKVIGHVGRLAKEKNLIFLTESVAKCLEADRSTVFLVVGDGEAREEMLAILRHCAGKHRVHAVGTLMGRALADAYAAMDCFVFASQTETQGLVLAEAMAAGKPVVAIDGSGVREIVNDGENGILLAGGASTDEFAGSLRRILNNPELFQFCSENARQTALHYGEERSVQRVLHCYKHLIVEHQHPTNVDFTGWDRLLATIAIEWDLFVEKMSAASAAVMKAPTTEAHID